ncbi:hypothetical protein C3943_13060 [Lysinibacillus sp. B2A1]|nr:hypothetical protein C3943_13060 [Lysinibacillus sp. B2A1]
MNLYNYYRSELKSKNIAKYKVIGITAELILDTTIFDKNEDIIPFLKNIYNLAFKEYVIQSRTTIIARTTRSIYEMNDVQYESVRKNLLKFLNGMLDAKSVNKIPKNVKIDFSKWMDGISDGEI